MPPGDLLTRPGQVQYGDLLLGRGTPYRWADLTGWGELPALDSGTVQRPDAHGAIPGLLLAQARTIGLEGLIVRARAAELGAVVGRFESGTVPVVDELPLVIWVDERGPLLCWARCVRRALPIGKGYNTGTLTEGAVEWEASDPRRYALDEQTAKAGLPAPEPGLSWPLAWPLDWGKPGESGALSVTNRGNAATHPVIEFRGPMTRPSLTNIGSGDTLEYDLPLGVDDVLTVDTLAGTATLNGTASRLYAVTARSMPEQTYVFPPGETTLVLRATGGPDASVAVRYRAAFW
ncbi:phage distal tail protein [Streptomyces iconiensis]|uniref:Phage tail family protein n=1 Tax=Streptomyces iconiensis TaxID=1384038 RepID=A0ABT7A5U6_9ACTN|nr:phage tail domain-containing protein [Streptomyces iconiensis]MDJ1136211.1 phage tail family protein [Streptomyces iconiensis]